MAYLSVHWNFQNNNNDASVIPNIRKCLCRTKLILTGDFNIPIIDWTRKYISIGADQNSEVLLDLTFSHNLQEVVLENTRLHDTSVSILDLMFLTEPVFSKWYTCKISEGISDPTLFTFLRDPWPRISPMPARAAFPDFSRASDVDIFGYFETNPELLLSVSAESTGIDHLWLSFKTIAFYCIDTFVPKKV